MFAFDSLRVCFSGSRLSYLPREPGLMLHVSYSTSTGSSKVWNLMDISRRITLDIIARWGYDTDFRVSVVLVVCRAALTAPQIM